MIQFLTDNEKEALNFLKEDYDKTRSISLEKVYPKLNYPKDTMQSLQSKGYLEISYDDFGYNHELVTIIFKEKFFEYFGININQ